MRTACFLCVFICGCVGDSQQLNLLFVFCDAMDTFAVKKCVVRGRENVTSNMSRNAHVLGLTATFLKGNARQVYTGNSCLLATLPV